MTKYTVRYDYTKTESDYFGGTRKEMRTGWHTVEATSAREAAGKAKTQLSAWREEVVINEVVNRETELVEATITEAFSTTLVYKN